MIAQAGRRSLAAGALLLAAPPAWAHGTLPGGGGFLTGALHPFAAVEHLVLLLALGLLMGRLTRERRGPGLALLAAGLALGLAAAATLAALPLPASARGPAILALALACGLLLALERLPPPPLLAAMGLGAGLLVGLDTDLAAPPLAPALGVLVGVFLIVLDAAALSAWATRPPFPIVRRVAGSWIAATAFMLLALALARPVPA